VVIQKCFSEESIPVYGDGSNVRDWIWAEEHCEGIYLALKRGKSGETYCFGGDNEWSNINLVQMICDILQKYRPPKKIKHYRDLIQFVTDRPGHDWRYSIDSSKARKELGFQNHPEKMRERLLRTIQWYEKH
jgi:dTDP-glucose 4,6-dehydratase